MEDFRINAKLRDSDEEKLYEDKFDTRETEEEIEEKAKETSIKYDDPDAIVPTENTNFKEGNVDFENVAYEYAKDLSEDKEIEVKPIDIPVDEDYINENPTSIELDGDEDIDEEEDEANNELVSESPKSITDEMYSTSDDLDDIETFDEALSKLDKD